MNNKELILEFPIKTNMNIESQINIQGVQLDGIHLIRGKENYIGSDYYSKDNKVYVRIVSSNKIVTVPLLLHITIKDEKEHTNANKES